jgi:hypothetical protein
MIAFLLLESFWLLVLWKRGGGASTRGEQWRRPACGESIGSLLTEARESGGGERRVGGGGASGGIVVLEMQAEPWIGLSVCGLRPKHDLAAIFRGNCCNNLIFSG